jgi:hypothetical protein
MTTGISKDQTVYKYVKEHYPISKKHRGARELMIENTAVIYYFGLICPKVKREFS